MNLTKNVLCRAKFPGPTTVMCFVVWFRHLPEQLCRPADKTSIFVLLSSMVQATVELLRYLIKRSLSEMR